MGTTDSWPDGLRFGPTLTLSASPPQDALGAYPVRQDLDAVVPDRPCIIYRRCWHVCVANSVALGLCGITAATRSPDGGVMDTDATGEPTGVLRETAMDLLSPVTEPETDLDTAKGWLRAGLGACVAQGITSVQTNDGAVVGGIAAPFEAYAALDREGEGLPLRVLLTLPHEDVLPAPTASSADVSVAGTEASGRAGAAGDGAGAGAGADPESACPASDVVIPSVSCSAPASAPRRQPVAWQPHAMLSCDRAKVFSDGGMGASTAALESPYSDDPTQTNCGVLQLSPEALDRTIREVHEAGWRLEVHAIGDRAARLSVAAMERAGVAVEDRAVLTHCQVPGFGVQWGAGSAGS